jgi:hypothetical protein
MMAKVVVKFYLEPSDPEDRTGLSDIEYDMVTEAIVRIGGYDIDFELIKEDQ